MNRSSDAKKEGEAPPELESQFILRLPPVSKLSTGNRFFFFQK